MQVFLLKNPFENSFINMNLSTIDPQKNMKFCLVASVYPEDTVDMVAMMSTMCMCGRLAMSSKNVSIQSNRKKPQRTQ